MSFIEKYIENRKNNEIYIDENTTDSYIMEANEHFYFYHYAPKNLIGSDLISINYLYKNKKWDLFDKYTDKYRDRIVNDWGYYNKNPNMLTRDEIYQGLSMFRQSPVDEIYAFRYPLDESMGPKIKEYLKYHDCYRIDLNSIKPYINGIYWGDKSINWYRNVSRREYFKDYDDTLQMNFITIPHIGIHLRNGYIPLSAVEKNPEDLFITEANTTSTIYKDTIEPKVNKVLSTPEGHRKFINLVGNYINKNNAKLTTAGPVYQLAFTQFDKEEFFKLFDITVNDINNLTKVVTTKINDKASWPLIKQNPIFVLFYYIIRYYTLKKDAKALNSSLIILALAIYPSVFSHFFKYEPNVGVMQYTIDNLSQRFIIKKSNHIFGTLTYSIQNSWKFHEKDFKNGADIDCITFIRRIRNDQSSLLRKIANNYYDNYKKGLSVYTTVDNYEDNINVDIENNTNKVELLTNRIVTQILINGLNLDITGFASNACNISNLELRNYLNKIIVHKKNDEIRSFIGSILFLFLYTDKHSVEEIHSKLFLSYTIALFKKTNSKDKNIANVKNILDKWGEDTGLYGKFSRKATRVDYTRGMFLYFVISIQRYS